MTATRTRPLRVLHVIPQLGSGGAERVALDLMLLTHGRDFETRLCVLASHRASPHQHKALGDTVFLEYNNSLRNLRGLGSCVYSLRRLILDWEADIVHSHLWPAARIAAVATTRTTARHIIHVHDAWAWLRDSAFRSRVMRTLTRWTIRPSRPTFVCVGTSVRDHNLVALSVNKSPVFVVPNGVDLSHFSPVARSEECRAQFRIGMVARLSPEKGHPELLRAIAKLTREGRKLEVDLAGDGSALSEYWQLTRNLGIADLVHFYGFVADVPSFLRRLDVFVLPSFSEGVPLTILEAMATGLPVIATSVGGILEVLSNEANALLVPPGDVEALACAIRRLYEQSDLRKKLGIAARETARQRYSHGVLTSKMTQIYKQVMM